MQMENSFSLAQNQRAKLSSPSTPHKEQHQAVISLLLAAAGAALSKTYRAVCLRVMPQRVVSAGMLKGKQRKSGFQADTRKM